MTIEKKNSRGLYTLLNYLDFQLESFLDFRTQTPSHLDWLDKDGNKVVACI